MTASLPEGPALWTIERGDRRVHLFGGRPALPFSWSAPRIEAVLGQSEELWTETPEFGPEMQALSLKLGIDPDAPLDTWLTSDDRDRVQVAAERAGVDASVLAPFRPWLAAQLLGFADASRRGVDDAARPETVLHAVAVKAGLPIRHEFPTAEALTGVFAGLPRAAELELLRVTLDDLEADPQRAKERARAWLAGDLEQEEAHAVALGAKYPAFYQHLSVVRNEAWVPRIVAMLDAGTRSFVLVGIGHAVGPDNVLQQLERAGLDVQRA